MALHAGAQTPPASAAAKRVEIDKTRQTLRAYEGDRLVLETRISTGKWDKSTPNGHFEAGEKQRTCIIQNSSIMRPVPYDLRGDGKYLHSRWLLALCHTPPRLTRAAFAFPWMATIRPRGAFNEWVRTRHADRDFPVVGRANESCALKSWRPPRKRFAISRRILLLNHEL